MSKLQIEYRPIDDITPYENNPRKNDEAVKYVMESIKEFGFINPILLDKDGTIMAGHTRLLAAKKLCMTEVPVVYVDDLNEEQAKAFRLADNKTAEIAEWDEGLLEKELKEILDIDMSSFGFDVEEELKKAGVAMEKPEVEFTEELLEENNYVVLFFDNSVDWLQAQSVLGITPKKAFRGMGGRNMGGWQKIGVGRVINGTKLIQKMVEEGLEL